jgi:hypothetical protein
MLSVTPSFAGLLDKSTIQLKSCPISRVYRQANFVLLIYTNAGLTSIVRFLKNIQMQNITRTPTRENREGITLSVRRTDKVDALPAIKGFHHSSNKSTNN